MYIVQEIQTTGGQIALLTAVTKTDRFEAESEFLIKAGYAAISNVEIHTIIWFDEHGNVLNKKYYEHFPDEPQEEAQPT